MFGNRVTVLVGHFGSGKTEIALNGVLGLAARGERATLVDLDVVKPYFRSRSGRAFLAEAGVELVAPRGDNLHADLPILVPQIRSLLVQGEGRVVMDVGGDDTGARVLGSLADVMPVEETECLLVLNFRRPFTRNAAEAEVMVREIEAVSRLRVQGLVSNTHLMAETTRDIVLEGYRETRETSSRIGVPVVAVTVDRDAASEVTEADVDCELVVMDRIVRPPFESGPRAPSNGPLFVLN